MSETRSMRRRARANGFSLLEVIAAILLLAIAFTALMQVAGGSIGLTNNAADYSRAALWARSLLDTADVGAPLRPGHTEGRFDSQYRWRLTVTPWRPADADTAPTPQQAMPPQATPQQMVKLDLDVLWGTGRSERAAHFSTLRLIGPDNSHPPMGEP
ncbi:prepilin-type N-terminal cleavage/methylation domain-containing protein [Dyella subtropica]|uniref:prepilin-type N-terminal cleavage/methylation domain-containing protein n=1 Tax=Dyella subtropica TaxID=2992127 RepID=UPI00224D204E|nr:prepilin-type N-terminal cleavage/methylation domain-containing protein [Dyella subtropica]